MQLESEPESGSGLFGRGVYFYESVQKALEHTLVFKTMRKKEIVDQLESLAKEPAGREHLPC